MIIKIGQKHRELEQNGNYKFADKLELARIRYKTYDFNKIKNLNLSVSFTDINSLYELNEDREVVTVGYIDSIENKLSKKNYKFAVVEIIDSTGGTEFLLGGDNLKKLYAINLNKPIIIFGILKEHGISVDLIDEVKNYRNKRKGNMYTKKEIKTKISNNKKALYKQDCINYKGKFKNGNYYIDYIAEEILNNIDAYLDIETIKRKKYTNKSHDGNTDNDKSKKNAEVLVAKRLFHKSLPVLGKILDYEIPLKKTNKDKGVGKIDLLAYNEEENILNMIELKRNNSKETLLRCVLEIESYYRYVWEEQLNKEYSNRKGVQLKKAILIFADTEPFKPIDNQDEYLNVIKLLKDLDISVYKLSSNENEVTYIKI